MAMSLDYMGKLVIVMVVVGVSIGIISSFRGDVNDTFDGLNPDEDDPTQLQIVDVSGNNKQKISDMIEICYDRSLDRSYEDFECFLARKDSGSFNIGKDELQDTMEEEVTQSTKFNSDTFDRSTIIIKYGVTSGKVIVEQ